MSTVAICVHSYISVYEILLFFCFYNDHRTPYYFIDSIYYSTADGRKFLHHCDVVHKFSDDVITQRRAELLQVHDYISLIGINAILYAGITTN